MRIAINLSPKIVAYLRELAPTGLYGAEGTMEEVAANFVMRGVERECRGPDGFLREPPKAPRKGVRG